MIIDLRSDTVTKPTPEMLEAMMNAEVGDDVYSEDPTVNKLEKRAASLFGMEEAIYCPSGSMTNQIAIKCHTQPGCEVICDKTAHVYFYEGGGIAFNSSASVRLLNGDNGRFTAEEVADNINPDNIHAPKSSLVVIENTSNRGGGSFWDFKEIEKIKKVCTDHKLGFHLDGARLFNALAETNQTPMDYGKTFDSISICLSKGLGAPVGSLLLGKSNFIQQARRYRKVLGGAMRQAGFLAAAGLYALENNVARLKEDHRRAKELEKTISKLSYVEKCLPVATNIVIFKLKDHFKDSDFNQKLLAENIKVSMMGKQWIRLVTHLQFNDDMLEKMITQLKKLS